MLLAATIDPARVTPGLLGFGITVMLGLATWLLLRSMNRHIGRVDFAEDPAPSRASRPRPGGVPRPGAAAEATPPSGSGPVPRLDESTGPATRRDGAAGA